MKCSSLTVISTNPPPPWQAPPHLRLLPGTQHKEKAAHQPPVVGETRSLFVMNPRRPVMEGRTSCTDAASVHSAVAAIQALGTTGWLNTPRAGLTSVNSALFLMSLKVIWRDTWWLTPEKNLSSVLNAPTQPAGDLIWIDTCVHILVKKHLNVMFVIILLQQKVICRNTYWHTKIKKGKSF